VISCNDLDFISHLFEMRAGGRIGRSGRFRPGGPSNLNIPGSDPNAAPSAIRGSTRWRATGPGPPPARLGLPVRKNPQPQLYLYMAPGGLASQRARRPFPFPTGSETSGTCPWPPMQTSTLDDGRDTWLTGIRLKSTAARFLGHRSVRASPCPISAPSQAGRPEGAFFWPLEPGGENEF